MSDFKANMHQIRLWMGSPRLCYGSLQPSPDLRGLILRGRREERWEGKRERRGGLERGEGKSASPIPNSWIRHCAEWQQSCLVRLSECTCSTLWYPASKVQRWSTGDELLYTRNKAALTLQSPSSKSIYVSSITAFGLVMTLYCDHWHRKALQQFT